MTRNLDDMSARQHLAIMALLAGDLQIEAAKKAKVHENEIVKWMKEPAFREALHEAQNEQLQALTQSLVAIATKACRELGLVLDDATAQASVKVRAADVVLTHLLSIRGQLELEERIAKLEAQLEVRDAIKT